MRCHTLCEFNSNRRDALGRETELRLGFHLVRSHVNIGFSHPEVVQPNLARCFQHGLIHSFSTRRERCGVNLAHVFEKMVGSRRLELPTSSVSTWQRPFCWSCFLLS